MQVEAGLLNEIVVSKIAKVKTICKVVMHSATGKP